ncbi:ParB N-terminal domain-containing protein [Mesorhizobium sp. M0644]|uniref:ParB/RepB/Spo0J family partition protein n=1 Tax=Mesorhizobium sp. M0644 TaxID=2956979 RepID=UPI00333A2359
MQLAHIPLDQLNICALNMRHGKRAPDISDILPSVRARGVLVPLLVRPNGQPETFEIVAGRRRYFAAKSLADERGEGDPLPCAIMEDGDDDTSSGSRRARFSISEASSASARAISPWRPRRSRRTGWHSVPIPINTRRVAFN